MTGNVFKVFVGWAWDKLFLKEFVDKYHLTFQEQRTSNDLLFVFSAVVLAKKISVVPMVLAHQRAMPRILCQKQESIPGIVSIVL